jgi:toxin ParE1/3/4
MPQAFEDLRSIEEFIGRDNPAAAMTFVQKITEQLRNLKDMPGIGRKRDDLAPGLRSTRFGEYLIFYRISERSVQVLHVVHGARDLPKFFERD